MVQKYKRKTQRQGWDEDKMQQAIEGVRNELPYKTAARKFLMTLKRHCKGKNKLSLNEKKKLGSKTQIFTEEHEQELVSHILDMESRIYGLTSKDVRSIAYQLAVKNGVRHPFSEQTKLARKDWLTGFRKRYPELSLRAPEATSAARALLDKTRVSTLRIFNVDETSISTVPGRNCKIMAKRGRKQVICMSAGGSYIPPMLIFSRKRIKEELKDGAPPGTVFVCNDSGWINLEVFAEWFDHFLSHVKPTEEDPAFLILDGHLSHTKNLNVIEKARNKFVTILCLPPHTTHRLQPLDLSFMYPLNHYHDQELEKWLTNHPASTPTNAINGFKKAGIIPYNPDVFCVTDFAAAEVTEQDEPENGPKYDEDNDQINIRGAPSTPSEQITRHEQQSDSSNAFKELGYQENLATSSASFNDINQHDNANVIPSTSGVSNAFKILPKDVHPLPKMSQNQRTTSKRRKEDEDDEESKVEEDVECLICSETFLTCPAGEGWVQCVNYHLWAHDECTGIEDNDCDPY
ncbi:hypothetical protein NQ314_011086 [Rhamnusium bicolor]|uniref:HTH CENPB-type domain-containing protein n=1 Tax=Rhamnusium bicolor TaxID=1586634 RepID=A0AAV8XL44_9CUCU|nr:hypothetical protein NQ314_011086 [Rhamnusium bicolor]